LSARGNQEKKKTQGEKKGCKGRARGANGPNAQIDKWKTIAQKKKNNLGREKRYWWGVWGWKRPRTPIFADLKTCLLKSTIKLRGGTQGRRSQNTKGGTLLGA